MYICIYIFACFDEPVVNSLFIFLRDENLDYSVMDTIGNWLDAIKMGQYTQLFIDQGFPTPKQVLYLTIEDLEELGIGPIGHRKKIAKAIKNTNMQVR